MSQESHLPPFAVRPRFEVELAMDQELVIQKINKGLSSADAKCTGVAILGFITIRIPPLERHYWSPELAVTFDDCENGKNCLLRGRYGPAPSVWTMFVFFYAVIGVVLMFLSVVGLSRYSLDMPASILWWVPALLVLLLSLYLVSYFGQKLGHDQLETLHGFLEKCLGMEIDAGEEGE